MGASGRPDRSRSLNLIEAIPTWQVSCRTNPNKAAYQAVTDVIEAGATPNGSAREELGLREPDSFEQRRLLTEAMARLSHARSIDELVTVLRECARTIARCDGVTVIRREGNRVAYIAEDAMSPLWAGSDFPIENCISGLAII